MKRIVVAVSVLLATNLASASSSVPVDTVIAWFGDNCNRPKQVEAFLTIIEYLAGTPYGNMEMITVKEEYDLTSIRNAFEGFVRSMTVDYDTTLCTQYIADPAIWDYLLIREAHEVDGTESMCPMFLSLYMNWGFTNDLYPIAERLSYGKDWRYTVILWDKLGTGFMQYIESKVNTPDFRHTGFAKIYLKYMTNPSTDMINACLSVLRAAAISSDVYQRAGAASMMVELYTMGYGELRDDIIALQSDSEVMVRNAVNRKIQFQQEYGRMMDFPLPGE